MEINKNKIVKKYIWGFLIISIIYFGLRLPNFTEKMTFHLDQGLHLLETKQMVESGKLRLIGPMVSSKTFLDRGFFIGPQYYYVLAVMGIIEQWNPLLMTLTFTVIEYLVLVIFCRWVYKKWNYVTALIVGLVLTISPYLIIHSRFIWNPHMMLWLTMLVVIVLDKWLKNKNWWWMLVVGIMWGIAFGFHYSAILWLIPLGILLIRNFGLSWIGLLVGFVIGDLPYIIFELRHGFYNIKTFYWVMSQSSSNGRMEAHYLINPLLGFLLVGIIWSLFKIKNYLTRLAVVVILIAGSYWWQNLIYAKERIPLGHPEGWTYVTEIEVVSQILKNGCPNNFNVASTISGDTRAYDLRYLLTVKNCPPMGVEDYPKVQKLFLIAPPNRPPETETVWEVSSLKKVKTIEKTIINDKVWLYELEKIK